MEELSAGCVLDDKVQADGILKGTEKSDHIGVIQPMKDLLFREDMFLLVHFEDLLLVQDFHGKGLSRLLEDT